MFECSKKDLEKFILSLTKGVMHYKYIDSWDKYNETLPQKMKLFGMLKNKGITVGDYKHVQREYQSKILVSIVVGTPPPLSAGGSSLTPNFQKGGLERTSTFRGGLLRKRGGDFF